jgi:hypothetical protein
MRPADLLGVKMIFAASAHVTGLPALLIILVILALLVIGAVVVVKAVGRGAKRVVHGAETHSDERRSFR